MTVIKIGHPLEKSFEKMPPQPRQTLLGLNRDADLVSGGQGPTSTISAALCDSGTIKGDKGYINNSNVNSNNFGTRVASPMHNDMKRGRMGSSYNMGGMGMGMMPMMGMGMMGGYGM